MMSSAGSLATRGPHVLWRGDAFAVSGLQRIGQIWIDAETYDLLRIKMHTIPVEFEKPGSSERIQFQLEVVLQFRRMAFGEPREVLMVPESETVTRRVRGDRSYFWEHQNVRTFSNFKRFSGEVTITPGEVLAR